jgi:hypothetical protein
LIVNQALPPARLTPALFVIGADRYGLQRRFDQAEGNTQIERPEF